MNGLTRSPLTFAEFARDHQEHRHCCACGGCVLDDSPHVMLSTPIWCTGCARALDSKLPGRAPRPWLWVTPGVL